MGNDGGVEKGRRLQSIFAGKLGSDEEAALARKRAVGEDMSLNLEKLLHEQGGDVKMPGIKFAENGLQLPVNLLVREGQRPADDGGDALRTGGDEGADDDARALRTKMMLCRWMGMALM